MQGNQQLITLHSCLQDKPSKHIVKLARLAAFQALYDDLRGCAGTQAVYDELHD